MRLIIRAGNKKVINSQFLQARVDLLWAECPAFYWGISRICLEIKFTHQIVDRWSSYSKQISYFGHVSVSDGRRQPNHPASLMRFTIDAPEAFDAFARTFVPLEAAAHLNAGFPERYSGCGVGGCGCKTLHRE